MQIIHLEAPNGAPNYNFWKIHYLSFYWNKKWNSYLAWLCFKLQSNFHVSKCGIFDAFEQFSEPQISYALAFFQIFCEGTSKLNFLRSIHRIDLIFYSTWFGDLPLSYFITIMYLGPYLGPNYVVKFENFEKFIQNWQFSTLVYFNFSKHQFRPQMGPLMKP